MHRESVRWPAPVEPRQATTAAGTLQALGLALVFFGLALALKASLRALGVVRSAASGLGLVLALLVVLAFVAFERSSGWMGRLRGDRRPGTVLPNGERRNPWQRSARGLWSASALLGLIGTALAIAPNYSPAGRALFGCLALVGVTGLVRHFWLGGIEVVWEPETLAPGRRAIFHVAATEGSSRMVGARYLLRCVGRDAGSHATFGQTVPAALSVLVECDTSVEDAPGPGEFIRVEFDVPADAPLTGSSGDVSTRWELLVHGRSIWGRVTEVFDVPLVVAGPVAALAGRPATA